MRRVVGLPQLIMQPRVLHVRAMAILTDQEVLDLGMGMVMIPEVPNQSVQDATNLVGVHGLRPTRSRKPALQNERLSLKGLSDLWGIFLSSAVGPEPYRPRRSSKHFLDSSGIC